MMPRTLLEHAGDTLGEMQSRVNKTRQVSIAVGSVLTAVGVVWTLCAIFGKKEEPPAATTQPTGTRIP